MTELTKDQLTYLLYAKAYAKVSEADTLTKSAIKSYLPDELKKRAEKVYIDLKKKGLIELKTKDGKTKDKKGNAIRRDGRFSLTSQGSQALARNLTTADYNFSVSKSHKILSAVLACLLPYAKAAAMANIQIEPFEDMSFSEFQEKFKELYFEERKLQELGGVVAIHKNKLLEKFQDINSENTSLEMLEKYFKELKSRGVIFLSKGEKDELVHWVE